jgi:hypothetical protein
MTHNKFRRTLLPTFLAIGALFTIFLAACTPPPAASATTTPTIAAAPAITIPDVAMTHSPVGTADITLSPDQLATVDVSVTGLAPSSTHAAFILGGSCAKGSTGQNNFILNSLVANSVGAATSKSSLSKVSPSIITSQGLYIDIRNTKNSNIFDKTDSIACADINLAGAATDLPIKPIHINLQGTTSPDGSVHGNTHFDVKPDSLVVTMSLSGLVPNSTHISHIHAGTCAAQGGIVYMLQTIKADAQGNATTTTTIKNPDFKKLAATKVYVNVHEAGTMDGMNTPQGFDPITCGNMVVNQ